MKRILRIAALLVMCGLVFIGCGEEENPAPAPAPDNTPGDTFVPGDETTAQQGARVINLVSAALNGSLTKITLQFDDVFPSNVNLRDANLEVNGFLTGGPAGTAGNEVSLVPGSLRAVGNRSVWEVDVLIDETGFPPAIEPPPTNPQVQATFRISAKGRVGTSVISVGNTLNGGAVLSHPVTYRNVSEQRRAAALMAEWSARGVTDISVDSNRITISPVRNSYPTLFGTGTWPVPAGVDVFLSGGDVVIAAGADVTFRPGQNIRLTMNTDTYIRVRGTLSFGSDVAGRALVTGGDTNTSAPIIVENNGKVELPVNPDISGLGANGIMIQGGGKFVVGGVNVIGVTADNPTFSMVASNVSNGIRASGLTFPNLMLETQILVSEGSTQVIGTGSGVKGISGYTFRVITGTSLTIPGSGLEVNNAPNSKLVILGGELTVSGRLTNSLTTGGGIEFDNGGSITNNTIPANNYRGVAGSSIHDTVSRSDSGGVMYMVNSRKLLQLIGIAPTQVVSGGTTTLTFNGPVYLTAGELSFSGNVGNALFNNVATGSGMLSYIVTVTGGDGILTSTNPQSQGSISINSYITGSGKAPGLASTGSGGPWTFTIRATLFLIMLLLGVAC